MTNALREGDRGGGNLNDLGGVPSANSLWPPALWQMWSVRIGLTHVSFPGSSGCSVLVAGRSLDCTAQGSRNECQPVPSPKIWPQQTFLWLSPSHCLLFPVVRNFPSCKMSFLVGSSSQYWQEISPDLLGHLPL